MWTNSRGISYYKKGNKYFKNTGWFEIEISKEEFDKNYGKDINIIVTKSLDERAEEALKIKNEKGEIDFMMYVLENFTSSELKRLHEEYGF